MSTSISKIRNVLRIKPKFQEVVVPPDIAVTGFDYQPPNIPTGPLSVNEFADKYILYEINRLIKGGRLERVSAKRGGRAIHLVLTTSPLLLSAPAQVQILASSLDSKDQRFAVWSKIGGDVWLVSGRTEGLRHAMFDYLYRLGIKYIGPHPSWTIRPTELPEIECSELMTPNVHDLYFAGNGGLNSHGVQFTGPIANAQHTAVTYWQDWYQQVALPSESHNYIGGDGGTGFTYFKQNALDADHTMLSYTSQYNIRGVSFLSGAGFPFYCFGVDTVLAKVCVNHHGTVNAGPAFPPNPNTPTPWDGYTVSGPFCTVTKVHFMTNSPPTPLTFSGHTITRADGYGSWLTELFTSTDFITIALTASNNGTFSVTAVTATVLTISGLFTNETITGASILGKTPRSPGTTDPGPDSGTPPAPSDYTSFDGLVKLFCEHTRDSMCEVISSSPDEYYPTNFWVSASPNDGPYRCECSKCKNMVRLKYGGTRDSTDSDLVFDLANSTALFMAHHFSASTTIKPGVAVSAYAEHSDLPAFPLQPNICVSLLPQTIISSDTKSEVISNWSAMAQSNPLGRFELGLQCTWNIAVERDLINISTRDAIDQFKRFMQLGYTRGFSTQCSYSNIACGPTQYVISRLAWRPNLVTEDLITEWFSVFGAAATIIQATFERIWAWFEIIPHEIGQLYLDMQAAQTALLADINRTSNQQTCLDHVRAYVHWMRLFYEFTLAQSVWLTAGKPTSGTELANYLTAIDNAMLHAWNMSLSMNAIQADLHAGEFLLSSIPANGTGTSELRAKWDRGFVAGSGFSSVSDPTTAQLTAIINSGVISYPIISGVTRRTFNYNLYRPTTSTLTQFTGHLAPIATTSDTTLIDTLRFCTVYQVFRFKKGSSNVVFNLVSQQLTSSLPSFPVKIRVLDDSGNQLQSFQYTSTSTLTTTSFTITVPAGSYTLEFNDVSSCNAVQNLSWPCNVPFVQLFPADIQGNNQSVKIYFYVPLGETKVVMAFKNYPYGPCNVFDDTGASVTVTTDGFAQYIFSVPAGHSGKIWSFTHIQAVAGTYYPYFENCPNLFAFNPLQMMVPQGLDGYV